MPATIERPSIAELDHLASQVEAEPLDRGQLIVTLRRVESGLRQRGRELERAGGLLDEEEKVARMSLQREEDRLRYDLDQLADQVAWFREEVEVDPGDDSLRAQANTLLLALRSHREAESRLVLESVDTEVGAGD